MASTCEGGCGGVVTGVWVGRVSAGVWVGFVGGGVWVHVYGRDCVAACVWVLVSECVRVNVCGCLGG